jgi:hypothetical protein
MFYLSKNGKYLFRFFSYIVGRTEQKKIDWPWDKGLQVRLWKETPKSSIESSTFPETEENSNAEIKDKKLRWTLFFFIIEIIHYELIPPKQIDILPLNCETFWILILHLPTQRFLQSFYFIFLPKPITSLGSYLPLCVSFIFSKIEVP